MAQRPDNFASLLAGLLGFALYVALSEPAAELLLTLWAIFAVLSLMALLERMRRGLARSGGGMSLGDFAALSLRATAIGLLLASLCVAVTRFTAYWPQGEFESVVVRDRVLETVEERLEEIVERRA